MRAAGLVLLLSLPLGAVASSCAQGRGPLDAASGGPDAPSGPDAPFDFPDAPPDFPDAWALDAPGLDAGPGELDAFTPTASDAGSADAASRDAGRCLGTMCGAACVDTTRDPMNCGRCGMVCVLPFASATCVAGRCTVAACEPGRGDCNTTPMDGCEDSCVPGSGCTTSCGSTGARGCASVCAPTCAPPAESCNATDDDCDGACDEDLASCRAGVFRAYSDADGGHLYTRDRTEATSGGFRLESEGFFFVYPSPQPGLAPLHRCFLGAAHRLYTFDAGCEGSGASYEGVLGYVATSPTCGARPLYRLAGSGDHFYTIDAGERDFAVSIGYVDEGICAYVW